MQLTLADKPVDPAVDLLVLARWSEARPAAGLAPDAGRDPDVLDELAAQLQLRLDETQISLWEQRA